MSKKIITPPDHIQKALNELIKLRYSDRIQEDQIIIDYDKWKNNLYTAAVGFYHAKGRDTALFEYKERDTTNGYEYYWYCTNDWND